MYFFQYPELQQLDELINSKQDIRLLKRYVFINSLNNTSNLEKSRDLVKISYSSAVRWLNLWNENGLDGLKINWGEGRPRLLTSNQLKQVYDYINNHRNCSYPEIHEYILKNFGIDYSISHLHFIARKKLKFNYGKPFPYYLDRPEDA